MCGLYGYMFYGKGDFRGGARLIRALGIQASARGEHATGIGVYDGDKLSHRKAPKPARAFDYSLPLGARAVIGHTRYTTQGTEANNDNNHPFHGRAAEKPFLLAHNGHISNDKNLRLMYNLPPTAIETDTYVAAQLLEAFDGDYKRVAESLEGAFTITILDGDGDLTIVRGDNPIHVLRLPSYNLIVYASLPEYVAAALKECDIKDDAATAIKTPCESILKISAGGVADLSNFDMAYNYYYKTPYDRDWYSRAADDDATRRAARDAGIDSAEYDLLILYNSPADIYDAIKNHYINDILFDALRAEYASNIKY